VQVLAVCTANLCRSPTAGALLQRHLRAAGTTATTRSAGLMGVGGPIPPPIVEELARRGASVEEAARIPLTESAVRDADLVIGLERQHVREVILLAPDVEPRAFTLKELVRRGEQAGPAPPNEPLAAWLGGLAAARQPADLLGESDVDDVADPYRGSRRAYRRAVNEIDELTGRVARLLAGRGARS
jgi:protein-tyrosine phosphatase